VWEGLASFFRASFCFGIYLLSFILEPSSVKYILFDHEVYLLEFICFNTTVICCHFIKQTSTKSFVVPSMAAQQQLGNSCSYQQQLCTTPTIA